MLNYNRAILTALVILVVACPIVCAEEQLTLSMTYAESDSDVYVLTSEGTICLDCPAAITEATSLDLGQSLTYSSRLELGTVVSEIVDGIARLNVRVNSVTLEVGGLDHVVLITADQARAQVVVDDEVAFDSTEGTFADFPIAALLFGRELFVVEIDQSGDILSMGLTGLLSAVADTPAVQQLFAQIADILPALLPKTPVLTGDTWEVPVAIDVPELGLNGGGELRFLLRSPGDPETGAPIHIGARGTLGVADFHLTDALLGLPMIGVEAAGTDFPSVRVSGQAHVKGDMYLDPTSHRVLSVMYTSDLTTQIDSGVPGLTVEVVIQANCGLERIEK